ncbi:MAG: regulatory iron-sulfur-containing complex subunit RicT [Anaerolineae bacterium]|nr:regulatory iron-sulfur-containing complex subunit RicT [Anaerolineae bacterium]
MSDLTAARAAPLPPPPDISIFDMPEWTGGPSNNGPKVEAGFAGVRFQAVSKIYHYRTDGFDGLKVNDWVIVETSRGKQMAQIATLHPPKDKGSMAFRRIDRRATGRDMATRHYYENKQVEAMIACRAESAALHLPVKIVKADYSFDGQILTFSYTSVEDNVEVDVSALHEAMSHLYQARIEMRQIGPREVAKILGGMGACGVEERCCSKFLSEFSPISIKHAKEQNISLNPSDITGMCGRLRCCLIYEYEQYVEARRHLPKLKSMIGTPQGVGKVVELLALRDSVKVQITEGDIRHDVIFHREQLVPLEEYQRLQEKALSGQCDKHEGGGCDCGRDKSGKDKDKDRDKSSAEREQDDLSALRPNQAPKPASGRSERSERSERKPPPERRPAPERAPAPMTISDGDEEIEVVSLADELGLDEISPRDGRGRDTGRPAQGQRDDRRRDDRARDDRGRDDRRRDDRARDDRGRDDRGRDDRRRNDRDHDTRRAPEPSEQDRRKPLRRKSE